MSGAGAEEAKMRRVLLGLLALLITACGGSAVRPTEPLDVRVAVLLGQTALLDRTGLALRFDAVLRDSRCPADALCVRQGEAAITVTLVAGARETRVELRTDPAPARVRSVDGLRLELVQLEPYPYSTRSIPPGEYRATLRVVW
jgi:hypothetical protein